MYHEKITNITSREMDSLQSQIIKYVRKPFVLSFKIIDTFHCIPPIYLIILLKNPTKCLDLPDGSESVFYISDVCGGYV